MSVIFDEYFIYDDNDSYENNFSRWWRANTVEREIYKERILPKEEAEHRFNLQWGHKYSNPIRALRTN